VKQPASIANWQALDAQLGPGCLRIASYNLHGCVGHDGARDARRIAGVIAELGCDTIGLQEVFGLETLREALNMTAIAGPDHLWHDRHVGNALLTRRKVLAVRTHDYSWPRHEPRTALDVDLDVEGETVRVIVTHLGLKPAERRYQVKKILSLLKETPATERVVVARPAAALAARPVRALPRRAHLPVALAALRPRPRLGAAAPRPARLRRAPLAARGAGFRSPAGQGDRRHPRAVYGNARGSVP
jgi:hypothetical protein